MSRASIVLPGVLWLCACGAPTATPKVEPKPAKVKVKVDDEKEDSKETTEKFAGRRDARMAKMAAMRAEADELLAAYAGGTLGDRLVAAEMVLVDAKAPANTDQTDYFLVPGTVPADGRTQPALQARQKTEGVGVKRMLVGGEDGAKPAVFRKVEPGMYTACAAIGPANSPEKEAYLAKAKELYGEDDPAKVDLVKMMEATKKAQVATGYKPTKVDWDKAMVRCKEFTVTADAASRVVVLDPA